MGRSKLLFALACVAAALTIALVVTLEHRASASRDAQVRLAYVLDDVDAMQGLPWKADGGDGGAHALARVLMAQTRHRVDTALAGLQQANPTGPLQRAVGLWCANVALLQQVRAQIAVGRMARAGALQHQAQSVADQTVAELQRAGSDYRAQASSAMTTASVGSAGAILLLLCGFFYLYRRMGQAHALSQENERVAAASRAEALTDPLTGLPNRRMFYQDAQQMIRRARQRGQRLAVLLVDLDGFKEVNDTLGHYAGDVLLGAVGPRLRPILRGEDLLARLGGDEFALIIRAADPGCVASRLAEALHEPFPVHDITVHIRASIGIAVFPEHGGDAEQLLRRADVAMYQAKASRSEHAVYDAARDRHAIDRLKLIGGLHTAIPDGQLRLDYEPQM